MLLPLFSFSLGTSPLAQVLGDTSKQSSLDRTTCPRPAESCTLPRWSHCILRDQSTRDFCLEPPSCPQPSHPQGSPIPSTHAAARKPCGEGIIPSTAVADWNRAGHGPPCLLSGCNQCRGLSLEAGSGFRPEASATWKDNLAGSPGEGEEEMPPGTETREGDAHGGVDPALTATGVPRGQRQDMGERSAHRCQAAGRARERRLGARGSLLGGRTVMSSSSLPLALCMSSLGSSEVTLPPCNRSTLVSLP